MAESVLTGADVYSIQRKPEVTVVMVSIDNGMVLQIWFT